MTTAPETSRHQGAVAATLAGVLDLLVGGGRARLDLPPELRLDGRTALITGATRGLGRAVADRLADLGATVIVTGRSGVEKAAAGLPDAEARTLDLADPASVDTLADALRGRRVDLLVLNAGLVPVRSQTTAAGLDLMTHVHLVGHAQLVDRLLADGALREGSRIVVVGSESHRSHLYDPDDWVTPRDYGTGDVVSAYGRSKLLVHAWAVELGRRLHGRVAVHHLCPGPVDSDIARDAPGWTQPLLRVVFRWFFQPPEKAARPVVWLAASPDIADETGIYLHMTERKAPSDAAIDPARGARLWERLHQVLADLPR